MFTKANSNLSLVKDSQNMAEAYCNLFVSSAKDSAKDN